MGFSHLSSHKGWHPLALGPCRRFFSLDGGSLPLKPKECSQCQGGRSGRLAGHEADDGATLSNH